MSGLIRSMRPRQWVKNGVVLAALVFARQGDRLGSLLRALAAMALFSLLASAVYLFNDLLDRERDRLHPKKRFRPIAAGTLSPMVAGVAALVLAAGSVGLAFWLAPRFGIVALAYLVLQVLYSTWLKHVVLLDVFAIAAGFVLRVVAGAVVIAVPISNWLYLCTLLLALFLACAETAGRVAGVRRRRSGQSPAQPGPLQRRTPRPDDRHPGGLPPSWPIRSTAASERDPGPSSAAIRAQVHYPLRDLPGCSGTSISCTSVTRARARRRSCSPMLRC